MLIAKISSDSMTRELTFKELEDTLLYFSNSLFKKQTEEELVWDLAENCISRLGFEDCVIYLIDHKNKKLIQKAAFGPKTKKSQDILEPIEIGLGEGISGSVAVSGVGEIVPDTTKDPRYIVDDRRRYSEIAVPISFDNRVLGVIDCEHHERYFFTDQHLKVLNAIAAVCGTKLTALRSDEKVRKQQLKLFEADQKLARLRVKAFHSQMNPHFVFNALNSVQHFIISNQKKKALNFLSLFGKLVRYNLKLLERETVDIQEEIKMLQIYFQIQKLRYENHFNVYIEITPEDKNAQVPSLIIQTLFENLLEISVSEAFDNYELKINLLITEVEVVLDILISHDARENSTDYLPEYRENIMSWENQIKSYKKYKGYKINKELELMLDDHERIVGNKIMLSLPNLSRSE